MSMPMNVPIVAATRTAVGRGIKGTLRDTRPDDLAGMILRAAAARVPGLKLSDIEDVLLGCAMPEGEQGLNIARNAVFLAGFPDSIPGETINRFCSSGLQAIAHAAQSIAVGCTEVMLAGGVESMSMVPMSGNKPSLSPTAMQTRPEIYIGMGHTAERVAKRFGVSREQQDAFAASSHAKAAAADKRQAFAEQITTVQARTFVNGKLVLEDFARDECPRFDTTAEKLGQLRPAFTQGGSVTAGNSSPLSDGAAALVMVSEKKMAQLGATPLLRMRAFKCVGVAPDIMGIGPLPAIEALLKDTGLSVTDIGLFEINEAFAAQAVYVARELKIPAEKLNVNGGAIALGHPLGCTGAKLTVQLAYEMRARQAKYGIVSMCVGGGMGAAGLFSL
jgi:acetyl-CoA acyltransferase